MKLYSTPTSTYARRPRIALLEKRIDVEEVFMGPDQRFTPEYLRINPHGRIPALQEGDHVIVESTAVLVYIEERFPTPPLVPEDPSGRAAVAMYVKLCDLEFTPYAVTIHRPIRMLPESEWDKDAMEAAKAPIEKHYAFLEGELEGREWLAGDMFSQAEVCYLPFLHFHQLFGVEMPPRVREWWERMSDRESARATVPAF